MLVDDKLAKEKLALVVVDHLQGLPVGHRVRISELIRNTDLTDCQRPRGDLSTRLFKETMHRVRNVEHGDYMECDICGGADRHNDDCIVTLARDAIDSGFITEEKAKSDE